MTDRSLTFRVLVVNQLPSLYGKWWFAASDKSQSMFDFGYTLTKADNGSAALTLASKKATGYPGNARTLPIKTSHRQSSLPINASFKNAQTHQLCLTSSESDTL